VNDTFGHEVGNRVLKLTARHLRATVREIDIVARYGGEEFAVICPETNVDDAAQLAERIRATFPQQVRLTEHPQLTVRASVGVATSEDPRVSSVSELINLCDQALYCSKHQGRDRVTRADELGDGLVASQVRADEVDRLRKEVVALSLRSKDLCLQSVWALIQALEARDGYSAWHSRNVMLYTSWLVEAADWPPPLRAATANAAMLHDLGKIGIPDELLVKVRPVNPREAAVLRQVPLITCKILEPLRVFETEILIIRHLRERFDGSGYPDGLRGNSIPIGSRLLAVSEAFDSITCNRAHRLGRSAEEAIAIICEGAGRQFDPTFVRLLEDVVSADPQRWKEQIQRARVQMPSAVPVEVP
jgi:diguanylate cyclase (GGDEF)-like protein